MILNVEGNSIYPRRWGNILLRFTRILIIIFSKTIFNLLTSPPVSMYILTKTEIET